MDLSELDRRKAMAAHTQFQNSLTKMSHLPRIRPSFTQDCSPAVPLDGLRAITLQQMEVDTVHYGRVLFGTLCVDPFMITAVMTVLADRHDPRLAVSLSIYNAATSRSTSRDLSRLFPNGCRVAVKEPFLKRAIDGRIALRVDNPANIEKLDVVDVFDVVSHAADPDEIRHQGNTLFAKGDSKGAIHCYTKCISSLLEQNKLQAQSPCSQAVSSAEQDENKKVQFSLAMAYSNRAEARILLSEYKEALADADMALAIDPKNVKSLFRRGRALNGLMEYEDASICLEGLLAEHPEIKDARTLLNSVKSRLANPAEILPGFSGFLLGRVPPPKLPDYIGSIEIRRTSDGRGRGLFASKDVEPGELLLLSNAAAVCVSDLKDAGFHMDLTTEAVNMASQEDLVTELVSLGMKSKIFLQMLYSLAASPAQESMEVPSIDLFTSVPGEVKEGLAIDITRIRQIVRYNAFEPRFVQPYKIPESMELEETTGLWLLPSFMNHSCLPNACRLHAGHTMIVHAASRILAGQEITISYYNPLLPLRMREKMSKYWGFVCACRRCLIERRLESRLQGLNAQFESVHAEATKHFPAFAADPKKHLPDFYAACFELNCLSKKVKKKINSIDSLTAAEKRLVLVSYSSGFLGKWFFSWALGNRTGLEESGIEIMEAMRSCMPGNYASFCLVARLALAARQAGPTGQCAHADYLMEQVKQECKCLVGKQKASTVEQLVERAGKILPIIF